ncbi:ABC transporter permease, partial [Streptomyces sp. TRM76130]|nr:ABC transporter permease [Streptomyces sp. TRM76130]
MLIFLMVNVMGDPIAGLCGDRECDPATAARLRAEFGLDQPVWQQYATYLGNVFTGDFGTAFNGQPVIELMGTAFPVTVRLTVIAVVFEVVIGITLGVVTGLRRGRPVDTGVLLVTLVVISVPTFVTGLLLQLLFGVKWGWTAPSVSAEARVDELILPGLVLASVSLAYVTRLTRTS